MYLPLQTNVKWTRPYARVKNELLLIRKVWLGHESTCAKKSSSFFLFTSISLSLSLFISFSFIFFYLPTFFYINYSFIYIKYYIIYIYLFCSITLLIYKLNDNIFFELSIYPERHIHSRLISSYLVVMSINNYYLYNFLY